MGMRLSGCRNVPIERPASNQRTGAGFDRRFPTSLSSEMRQADTPKQTVRNTAVTNSELLNFQVEASYFAG